MIISLNKKQAAATCFSIDQSAKKVSFNNLIEH